MQKGGVVTYCNAEAAGITGEAFILATHAMYVLAAVSWVRSARRVGAMMVPAAAIFYALDSFLWHATGWRGFLAGDGALTVFFLSLGYFHAMRSTLPLPRAAIFATAYLPLYAAGGKPIYYAAMVTCGLFYLRLLFLSTYRTAIRWFLAALSSILVALTSMLNDAAWCGVMGFVTGHGLCHFFDGLCFYFLMGGLFRDEFGQPSFAPSSQQGVDNRSL